MMYQRYFGLVAISILCSSVFFSCSKETLDKKPNIILIQADDLGFSDLGIHGNPYVETPHLDQLAEESMQFRQFYVTPVCATTRAALLTGKHHLKTGVSHVHGGKDFLSLSEKTLADRLKALGYQTGMWGKWHSGKTEGYFPWQRGFDEAYMAGLYQFTNNKGLMNGKSVQHEGWTPEILTDYAIDFISRNKEKPFFAYVPYLTCHGPIKAKPELKEKYLQKGLSEGLATLYGMIDLMDNQIGRLLAHLDNLGLAENTIVIFISDNGPAINHRDLSEEDRKIRYLNNLRGHKGNIWENGVKSPLFIRWKGVIKPALKNDLVDVTDLAPTLLKIAGSTTNTDFDGKSIFILLTDEETTSTEKEIFLYAHKAWQPSDKAWSPEGVYNEYEPITTSNRDTLLEYDKQVIGIRTQRYKLLLNASTRESEESFYNGYALYDIQNDATESKNIFMVRQDIAEKLINKLKNKYQENFLSDLAFKPPTFIIKNTSETQKVLAYAPELIKGNPINAFNYLGNWQQKGDQAIYIINVKKAGVYQVAVSAAITQGEASYLIKANQEEKEIVISTKERAAPIALSLEKGRQEITLELKSKSLKSDIKVLNIEFTALNGS